MRYFGEARLPPRFTGSTFQNPPRLQGHDWNSRTEKILQMANVGKDRWIRVQERLRASVGEDIYTSWFARMDLESVEEHSVRMSVPTRFLKSWIHNHYADRVLTCWQAECPEINHIDLSVRSAVRPMAPPKDVQLPVPGENSPHRIEVRNGATDSRSAP